MAQLVRSFLFLLICLVFSLNLFGQCSTSELIPVVSFESNYAIITVDGLVNGDLSSPNQGLCGVFVRMKHAQIGELELKLKSPLGQEISLIGPQGSFGLTSNTSWAITFLPDAIPVSPDSGFSDTWSSNQPWGVFGTYTGTYHPSNSPLESFNTGNANGDWIITASDGFQFDEGVIEEVILFFCDSEGLSCNPCLADSGLFSISSITSCISNTGDIILEPTFPNGQPNETYEYFYIVREEEEILGIYKELNLSDLNDGDYFICGMSLKKNFEDQIPFYEDFGYSELITLFDTSHLICGMIDTNCVSLHVLPLLEDIVIDTSLCQGQYIVIEDDTLRTEGYFEIEKNRGDSCAQRYKINLDFVILEGNLEANSTKLSCTENTVLIDAKSSLFGTNTQISWDTPNGHILEHINDTIIRVDQPGLYVLNLQQGGCNYSSNIYITSSDDFPNLNFQVDSLNCQNGSAKIDLVSNVDLQSVTWIGPNGFSSFNEDPVVTLPGEYTVSVISESGCTTTSKVDVFQVSSSFDVMLSADSLDCLHQTVVINDSSSTKLISYLWTGPNGFTFDGQNPVVNQIGKYLLTAQDSFGCIKEFDIYIGGNLDSFEVKVNTADINCPNEFVDISVSYEVLAPVIKWSGPGAPFSSDSIISVNQSGDYSVELSSNGCTVISNFTINDNFEKLPKAEPFQLDSLSCKSPSTILFANIIENAGNALKVNWSGPDGFLSDKLNPIVSQFGEYTLMINTINNCKLIYKYDVFISQTFPSVKIDTMAINCAHDFGEIHLELNNYNDSIHVFGPNGYSSNLLSHSNLVAGSYTIEVYDSTGCKNEFIVPIQYDTLAHPVKIVPSNLLDCNNTELKLFTSQKYDSYTWSNSAGFLSNLDTISINSPGEVYLEVISSNQCVSTDTFIIEPTDANINILDAVDKTLDCKNTSAILEVITDKPIAKYNWEGPDGFIESTSQPVVTKAGIYTITVTGINGCVAADKLVINIDTIKPNITTEYDHILTCQVDDAILSGGSITPDVSYLWTGPSGIIDTMPAVLVNDAGKYIFTVTGKNNCENTQELYLPFEGVFAEISAKSDTVFCKDDLPSVSVESNLSNVQLEWTGPGGFSSDLANPVVNLPGKYYVSVTTDKGCVTTDSAFVIFKNHIPKITLTNEVDTLNCQKTEVLIDVSVDISTNDVMWIGPNGFMSSNLDVNVSEAGKYELIVEGDNNCTSTLELHVEQDTVTPLLDLSVDTISCNFPSVKINVKSDQSISQLNWGGPNNFTSSLLNNIDVFEKGMYTVMITGTNFCTNSDSIEVLEDKSKPNFTLQNDTLNCSYDLISLKLMDDSNSNTYSWNGPNNFSSNLRDPMVNTAGLYDVIVTGKNGCTSSSSLDILDLNYYPKIECSKSDDLTCIVQEVKLVGSEINTGEKSKWEGPNISIEMNNTVLVSVPGIYKYIIEGFTGCISEKIIEVKADTLSPLIQINQVGEVRCEYDQVDIHAIGSSSGEQYKYLWHAIDGKILDGESTLNPVISGLGKYTLTIENLVNGCMAVDSISVEEEFSTLEDLGVTISNISCHKDSLGAIVVDKVIGGFSPYQFAREGYSYDTLGVYQNLDIGKYNITVKDSFGCKLTKEYVVQKDAIFKVDLGQDVKVKLGEAVNVKGVTTLDFAQIDSIIWMPSEIVQCDFCLDFDFVPESNTRVTLQIVDKNGCVNYDEKIILVDDEVEIYIPNIFSPNGDGLNDLLTVSNSKMVEEVLSFKIYDRWGSVMHEEYNFPPGQGRSWDGKHLGGYVVSGVFPYTLEMKLKNGEITLKKGTITIVK